jgi:hypothetical protein
MLAMLLFIHFCSHVVSFCFSREKDVSSNDPPQSPAPVSVHSGKKIRRSDKKDE